ncbi:glycosyltransferase [Granulicella sp. S156]|uniref:glycosyltransferase n=1 Tax=Granulicella sp. S156 TaxID=1747224 RepID=UPI00131B2076|nr:glycosyltransferase [Granulicella sp. S156]
MNISSPIPNVRFFVVVVLYQLRPTDSKAFQSLQEILCYLPHSQRDFKILLYDNTPGGCDPGPLPKGVQYEAAEQNAGLATAYNRALSIAQSEKATWLLILDQDTTLPANYLAIMSRLACDIESDRRIAAIVPRMLDAGKPIAPVFIRFWGVSYLPSDFEGTAKQEIHATNSATLFRVDSLKRIGGFNPYFWLDYVDGYIFHQLYLHGLKTYVASDVRVGHELSLLHKTALKPDRFHNILRAESSYWDLYGGTIQGLSLTVRLFGRIWRQRKRGHDSTIRKQTWNEIRRRCFRSRGYRINDWMREMEQRMLSSPPARHANEFCELRPRISVCMAAYNGEQYIAAQLKSILCQLSAQDEVIVVDDASTDGTRDCVRSLQDGRVRLIEHGSNLGVQKTFEEAIGAASGDILFLSDQDDLWAANKVSTVVQAFLLRPGFDVVVSDAALIDENGVALVDSYYEQRGRFRSGLLANIIHCTYLGCTMAFRSRIRDKVLPFPSVRVVLHDVWIGTANSVRGGKTLYIPYPLVLYRRHEGNVTGNSRLGFAQQVRNRWALCLALARLCLR